MDSLTCRERIPFTKDLEHVQHYLAIEKMRFDDALTITYDISFTQFTLPPLTLQPIVENAVKYSLCNNLRKGTVHIASYETSMHYTIIVTDNGIGFPDATAPKNVAKDDRRSHIGITNVTYRLKTICNGELLFFPIEEGGTRVEIQIPKS